MRKLLTHGVVLLLERERLKHHRVVLVLQRAQQRRHRRVRRRPRERRRRRCVSRRRTHIRTRLERDQIVERELLARDRVAPVLINVPLNEPLLIKQPALFRGYRLLGRLARDCVSVCRTSHALAQNIELDVERRRGRAIDGRRDESRDKPTIYACFLRSRRRRRGSAGVPARPRRPERYPGPAFVSAAYRRARTVLNEVLGVVERRPPDVLHAMLPDEQERIERNSNPH